MKRCPECRRDYHDDTLLYCLDDGSALLEGHAGAGTSDLVEWGRFDSETKTALFPGSAAPSEAATQTLNPTTQRADHPPSQDVSNARGTSRRLVLGLVALLLLGFGGYWGYRYFSPEE